MAKGERPMVPPAEPTSYYGRPVLKEPTWKWPIPAYFFSGGLAAGTGVLALGARAVGDRVLAERATFASLAAAGTSGAFLVRDLGRPSRFYNMLRVLKPTSPMSVGTWVFSAFAGATGLAGASYVAERAGLGGGIVLRSAGAGGQALAGALAPALATYTAVLVSDTAVPAWHEARREMPWLFAGGAAASGGACGVLLAIAGASDAGRAAARRMTLAGAVCELAAMRAMHRRLRATKTGSAGAPDLASPYRKGVAGRLSRLAAVTTAAGCALLAAAPRLGRPQPGGRRANVASVAAEVAGSTCALAGAALDRFAVFHAGRASAADPVYTVGPQRAST